ncbi:MAG: pyruvate kinase [Geobacteraceae bacterium]|nr:pyruvate kinase [Geobacteraceae bacterium]
MNLPSNKTKIVCTIGPASDSPEMMERLLLAGMNIARLNFSHGDFTGHGQVIRNLRAASVSTGRRLAILADLPGPKMRIGQLASEPIHLNPGDRFILTSEDVQGDNGRVAVSFPGLPRVVAPGATLFLNDGIIQLDVEKVEGSDVHCRIVVGGELRSRKGLNLPGIDLGISAFTDHDRSCLKFALENGVDAVSQSFVNRAEDIIAVRAAAAELGHQPFIIAKIERSNALEYVEEIIDAADGIMIARGDLGVEVPIEQIPVVQKRLTRLANKCAKPVITATQMLESMTFNSRPTRAEATDVANAILDGTDCVMLSAESAMGNYPVESVEMLVKIAAAIEPHRPIIKVEDMYKGIGMKDRIRPSHIIALGVETSLEYVTPAAVFVPTRSGATARRIASFRLPVWIAAVSSQDATCQRLQFSSGVCPLHEPDHPEDWNSYAGKWVSDHGLTGEMIILTEGPSTKHPEANHRMEVIELKK